MELWPITIQTAKAYVADLHRHHKPPLSGLFALAAAKNGQMVGVIIVGRPVARPFDNGITAEVTRCCTDGTRNACSFLYGAAWKAARTLGYRRMLTYTLPEEGGGSLRGAGWTCDYRTKPGRAWNDRWNPATGTLDKRANEHPLGAKDRWTVQTEDYDAVCGSYEPHEPKPVDDNQMDLL